jgi:glycosyltransferase involved in cell wall biosynthesis
LKVSLVVPVYGSEKILKGSYESFSKAIHHVTEDYEILFRIDGSPDGSAHILKKVAAEDKKVKIYEHNPNRGLGYTLRKLFEDAKGEYIIYFDADAFLCFDLSFLPSVMEKIENRDAVIASRYFENPLLPFNRWLASEAYYLINKVLFGIKIRDIGSGFVIFRRSSLGSLDLISDGFEIHAEIFVKMAKRGFQIIEVPLAYKHWSGGSFKVFSHGLRALIETIKLWRSVSR